MGKLSQSEFDAFLTEAGSSTYNSLILNVEILPVLKEKYLPVYGRIIDYNKKIDNCEDKDELKSMKEEMAFTYDIPNRQYLSAKIDIRLKGIENAKDKIHSLKRKCNCKCENSFFYSCISTKF